MLLIFVLALTLIKLVSYYSRAILSFFSRTKVTKKNDNPITSATLKLLRQSPSPPEASFNADMSTIAQLIKESPNVEPMEVLNQLQRIGIFPDINVYNTLLENFITEKDFQKAYQLFMEIKESSSLVSPNVNTYDIYLRGVLSSINSGGQVDIGMIDELLKEMDKREISPRVSTFKEILEICIVSSATYKAWEYFVKMQDKYKLAPDCTTHWIILRGIRSTDRTSQCFDLMFPSLMGFLGDRENEIEDNLINTVVDICGKFSYPEGIEQLLDVLKKRGRQLGMVAYGKIITIYGQIHKSTQIDELLKEIRKLKLEFNEVTYGCVMEAYLRCGLYDKVEEIYQEAQKSVKFSSNIIIHTTLIRALAKKRDFRKVIAHYDKLKRSKECKFNRIAYNALLDCCVKCGQYDKMSEIFEDMLKEVVGQKELVLDENDIEPDLITYSTLIKGMCKSGAIHKAIMLYEEMKKKGIELDEVFFNSLLDGFVKSNCSIEETDKIINDMVKLKIKFSNYTYSILIKLYTKNKMLEKALGVLEEMKRNGIVPGVVVYTCLLQVCIKTKMVNRAIELFKEMRQNKIQPDRTAYNIIVNGCIFSGKLLAACNILSQAMAENIILHDDVYNNILKNLPTNHKMTWTQKHEHATSVCNYVRLRKIPVNEEYFQVVLNQLVFSQTETNQQYYEYYQPQGYYYYQHYYQGYADQTKFQQPYYRKHY
jgi:pentatricopeptide repeat domain-containing protein 1